MRQAARRDVELDRGRQRSAVLHGDAVAAGRARLETRCREHRLVGVVIAQRHSAGRPLVVAVGRGRGEGGERRVPDQYGARDETSDDGQHEERGGGQPPGGSPVAAGNMHGHAATPEDVAPLSGWTPFHRPSRRRAECSSSGAVVPGGAVTAESRGAEPSSVRVRRVWMTVRDLLAPVVDRTAIDPVTLGQARPAIASRKPTAGRAGGTYQPLTVI